MDDEKPSRSDAGIVQLTERDQYILTWIAEQYAIRFDQLQRLLGRHAKGTTKTPELLSVSGVRKAVDRWKRAELIDEPRKVSYQQPRYVWVSRQGLSTVALPYPYYEPRPAFLASVYHANNLRLQFESVYPDIRWISRRTLRAAFPLNQPAAQQPHQPTAELDMQDAIFALEVELTKRPRTELHRIYTELANRYPRVWLYVHPQVATQTLTALVELDAQLRHRITPYNLTTLQEVTL